MKNSITTLFTSFIYIPATIIGHISGTAFTFFLNWWNSTMYYNDHWIPYMYEIGQFLGEVAHIFIPGILGGYLAALSCSKINQNYNIKILLIIPALLSILAVSLNLFLVVTQGNEFRYSLNAITLLTFFSFYYFLKTEFKASYNDE